MWEFIKKYLHGYLVLSGVLANSAIVAGGVVLVLHYMSQGYSLPELAEKAVEKLENRFSFSIFDSETASSTSLSHYLDVDIKTWESKFPGAHRNSGSAAYDESGQLLPFNLRKEEVVGIPFREISVTDVPSFLSALKKAGPGTEIVLEPGRYKIKARSIRFGSGGNPAAPIYVSARRLGDVLIEMETLEGFYIDKPFWVVQGLVVKGACKTDSQCEHAFHVVGNGKNTIIRDNIVNNFNAHVKVNGVKVGSKKEYPDNLLIENNSFYNDKVRNTSKPVTLLDILGVNDSVVRGNMVANSGKGEGNNISYAAFFKGGGSNNIFEQNLIICDVNLMQRKGARVGLSFGGGGTGQNSCRDNACGVEQSNGIMRNNIIMHCDDVGIYLNKSENTQVYNNTLINTLGIDIRFEESTALVGNNMLTGRIKDRNSGSSRRSENFVVDVDDVDALFLNAMVGDFSLKSPQEIVDKGKDLVARESDFCGADRGPKAVDLGAIEYINGVSMCVPLEFN